MKRIAVKTVWWKVDEVRSQLTICTAAPRQQGSTAHPSAAPPTHPPRSLHQLNRNAALGLYTKMFAGPVHWADCILYTEYKQSSNHICPLWKYFGNIYSGSVKSTALTCEWDCRPTDTTLTWPSGSPGQRWERLSWDKCHFTAHHWPDSQWPGWVRTLIDT